MVHEAFSHHSGGGSLDSIRIGDKLSVDLAGRPLLLRTVEIFSRRQEVFQIIVAGPPDSMDAFKERFGAGLGFHGVALVAGGERIDGKPSATHSQP